MDSIDKILLGLCLAVGVILRCYNPYGIPFINDELSALNRIDVGSFSELINNAVWNDTHPAFTHVLMYLWTGIFGTSELAVKLPFMLMGIASIYLVFKITQEWFSTNAGLYATALYSTLQFGVMYVPIARPYSSGLFLLLWMVWAWTALLFSEKESTRKYWISFVLAGALCLYNHYFTAISAVLVGLSGFMFVSKQQLKSYLLAGLAIGILFIPHLRITYHHIFEVGGVAWYGKPTWQFPEEHFLWIFHNSRVVILAISLAIIAAGSHSMEMFVKRRNKLRLAAFGWFVIPLVFGVWYSIEKSPILRTSHLVFSYPFMLMFFGSFVADKWNKWWKSLVISTLLVIITWSLIYERWHFKTVYNYAYKEFVTTCQDFLSSHERDEVTIVFGETPAFTQRYMDLLEADFEYWKFGEQHLSPQAFKEYIKAENKPYLIFGAMPEVYQPIAIEQYPYIHKLHYGINYELLVLAKEEEATPKPFDFEVNAKTTVDFWRNDTTHLAIFPWRYHEYWIKHDSLNPNNPYYEMPVGEEWGPTLEQDASEWIRGVNRIIDIAIDIKGEYPSGKLVFVISKDEKDLFWQAAEVSSFEPKANEWTRVYYSIRIAHVIRELEELEGAKIKTFFWNEQKNTIRLDNFVMQSRPGNPILYGDLRKINP
ncbi:MAG: glycosyltransferase family 39 protein [Aureispira sp.]|nr:glycosyltransferase family 39 protein [Aureispira sp.]